MYPFYRHGGFLSHSLSSRLIPSGARSGDGAGPGISIISRLDKKGETLSGFSIALLIQSVDRCAFS